MRLGDSQLGLSQEALAAEAKQAWSWGAADAIERAVLRAVFVVFTGRGAAVTDAIVTFGDELEAKAATTGGAVVRAVAKVLVALTDFISTHMAAPFRLTSAKAVPELAHVGRHRAVAPAYPTGIEATGVLTQALGGAVVGRMALEASCTRPPTGRIAEPARPPALGELPGRRA